MMDDFFDAIESGDIATVRACLEANPSLANAIDTRTTPGLRWQQDPSRRGSGFPDPPKPQAPQPRTITALVLAVSHQRADVARLLLKFGAEVPPTILCSALPGVGEVSLDLIRMLVERGSDVNARMKLGDTPLTRAFHWCWDTTPVVEYLLAHGADVNAPGQRGSTPLDQALIFLGSPSVDHVRMVKILLRHGANVRPVRLDPHAPPPMFHVARNGNIEVARILIEAGADVNASSQWGTPLHEAAEKGNDQLVKILLDAGADPSVKDPEGRTPLDRTKAYQELLSQVELLLEQR